MRYSLDSSAIIEAWLRKFPPDLYDPLWKKLEELIDKGDVRATKLVLKDLEKYDSDEIFRWAKKRINLFVDVDEEIQREVTRILAIHPKLTKEGGRRSGSDPFVIALAKLNNACVVTYENPTNSLEKPNIPDVCRALNVEWKDMQGLVRDYGWKFSVS